MSSFAIDRSIFRLDFCCAIRNRLPDYKPSRLRLLNTSDQIIYGLLKIFDHRGILKFFEKTYLYHILFFNTLRR